MTGPDRLRRPDEAARLPRGSLVLTYAVTLLIAWAFVWTHHLKQSVGALEADEREYYNLSSLILHGNIVLDPRRTLAFPLVIAALRAVWDNLLFVQVTIAAIYALSGPLLVGIVRRLGGSPRAALGAGLIFAMWPPSIYYGTSLYSETVALPVFLAALLLLPPGERLGRQRMAGGGAAILAGIVLGLATHVRPMYLLFTPFVALIAIAEEVRVAPALRRVVLVAAGYLLLIAPWSVLMTGHFGRPILVTSNGGETLAGGLNPVLLRPEGSGIAAGQARSAWYGPGKWLPLGQNGYLTPRELHRPYEQLDPLLRARVRRWTLAHPVDAARIEVAKVGYMWGLVGFTRNGWQQLLFGNLPTLALVALSIALAATTRGVRTLARLWWVPLFVSAVALISWGSWRFRQPADAALLGFCALCLDRRLRRGQPVVAPTPGTAR